MEEIKSKLDKTSYIFSSEMENKEKNNGRRHCGVEGVCVWADLLPSKGILSESTEGRLLTSVRAERVRFVVDLGNNPGGKGKGKRVK